MILGISKRTLQHDRNSGLLPYSFIGNKIYYPADAIRRVLVENFVKPENR
ncbi:helix-turn-helix domain-containing protein [Alistipes indistinctus]|nr:helix-turn-helix domain-containing protein [Alistipes indistinctus]